MAENKDGGQAFPHGDPIHGGDLGMSLRDWFAGHALAGTLANPDISASAARCKVSTADFRVEVAKSAYAIADAMLAVREKSDDAR